MRAGDRSKGAEAALRVAPFVTLELHVLYPSKTLMLSTRHMQIAMCEMERTRRGGLKKSSDYAELLVNSADTYVAVLMKACDILNLQSESAVFWCGYQDTKFPINLLRLVEVHFHGR